MQDIKLGIIGTNFISDWMCESIQKTEGITNHAVYSRGADTGSAFAGKYGIQHVFTDLEAFLSSDIDAVYIASPNFLHVPQAMAAIAHGKHILLEKPAALSEAEFTALEAAASDAGVILMEAMRPAHDPVLKLVRNALSEIGTVRRAVFDFCQYSSRYDKFKSGVILNAFDPSLGNAALMDIGVYALHCCVNLFGEPLDLYSQSVMLHNGMEGMGSAFLDYGDFQAEVVYSKITDSATPSVIIGEDGYIAVGKLSEMRSAELSLRSGEQRILAENRNENNMIYEAADFVSMIRGTLSPAPFNKNTKITLRLMDKIRAQNGIVFSKEA